MTSSNYDVKAARALQGLTGWSYQNCLQLSQNKPMETIEALLGIRGVKYNVEDELYLLWKARAEKASGERNK